RSSTEVRQRFMQARPRTLVARKPESEPRPLRVEAPDEDPGFAKMMEKITGVRRADQPEQGRPADHLKLRAGQEGVQPRGEPREAAACCSDPGVIGKRDLSD